MVLGIEKDLMIKHTPTTKKTVLLKTNSLNAYKALIITGTISHYYLYDFYNNQIGGAIMGSIDKDLIN